MIHVYFQQAIPEATTPAYPGWVVPAMAGIGVLVAATVALLVKCLDRPGWVSDKFRDRVTEGRSRLKAQNYQPELRDLITEVALRAQQISPSGVLDAAVIEAITLQFGWERRINALSEALSKEQELARAFSDCKKHQLQLNIALVVLLVWLVVGLIGTLAVAAWLPGSPQVAAAIFGTVGVFLVAAAIATGIRAVRSDSALDDWLTRLAGERAEEEEI